MRIIGEGQDRTLILEASRREVARLVGYYFDESEAQASLRLGAEIEVSKLFQQLYDLRNAKDRLQQVAADLRRVAGLIEIYDPIVRGAAESASGDEGAEEP